MENFFGPENEGEQAAALQQYDNAIAVEVLCNLDQMATDAEQVGAEWMEE